MKRLSERAIEREGHIHGKPSFIQPETDGKCVRESRSTFSLTHTLTHIYVHAEVNERSIYRGEKERERTHRTYIRNCARNVHTIQYFVCEHVNILVSVPSDTVVGLIVK